MTTQTRLVAQQLASHGRFGDSMLLHVNPLEVAGIASLVPGGRLTINPETGLPEAFFFLPFLAAMFGAAAPAAAAGAAGLSALAGTAAAGAGAAAAGTAAAGLTAATAAPALTASLGAGLGAGAAGTLAAAAPTALGAAAAPAALGAAAAPAALTAAAPIAAAAPTAGITSLLGGGGAGTLAGGAGIDAMTTGAVAAPAAAPAYGGVTGVSSLVPVGTPVPTTIGGIGMGTGLPVTPTPITSGLVGGEVPANVGNIVSHPLLSQPAAAVVKAPVTTGLHLGEVPANVGTHVTTPIAATTPPAADSGGLGGLSKYLDMKYILPATIGLQAIKGLIPAKGGKKEEDKESKKGAASQYTGGDPVFEANPDLENSAEANYFDPYKPIKYFANGGIVSLANGGPVDPQQQMPQDMQFPINGGGIGSLASAPSMEDLPTSDYPTSQLGSTPEPDPGEVPAPTDNDKELIMQTVEAIQGKVQDPNPILLAFIKEFGEQAFQDLVTRIKSSQQPQQGQQGQQNAALSDGEVVIPSDAVSHIGNGSTDAGAKKLMAMVGNVRQQRTGNPNPPPQVKPERLVRGAGDGQSDSIPVVINGYRNGGLVKPYKKGGKVSKSNAPEWSWSEFFNPLSGPPGSDQADYPTLHDVVVPPPSGSTVEPPSMWEFLNPFSAPPGQQQQK